MTLIPMAPSIELEDRTLYFVNADGQWWIAIKPICDALGIDFEAQRKRIKRDPILSQLPSNQTVVAADAKPRKMICLPERFIYGWLFQLESKNPRFLRFKRTCYEALYEYFHGGLSQRKAALREQVLAKQEMAKLRRELGDEPRYQRLQELQGVVLAKGRELKLADRAIEQEQLALFAHLSAE